MSVLATIDQHRNLDRSNMGAACQLMQLQREQFDHDEAFHREVARLDVKRRLTHMALHFSKYVGYVGCHVKHDDQVPPLNRVVIDCFIIALSSANILNVRLSDQLGLAQAEYSSIREVADRLCSQESESQFSPAWLLAALSVPAGRMAKSCEALDHLEALAYRDEITAAIVSISKVSLVAASWREIDLLTEVRSRLRKVKEKSIFFSR